MNDIANQPNIWKEALNFIIKWLTNKNLLKAIAIGLLISFYIIQVTYKIPLPAAEDLPRQMKNGQEILRGDFRSITQNLYSYTQTDHYFANHHWLYGVFAYLLYQGVGWDGMVIFKVLFILLTFVILFKTALQKANFWLVAICSVPAILLMVGRADLRPELFGYFFIVLYIYMLLQTEKKPSNKIFWLIPMQLLWANLHITWPIGIMLVGGFLIEKMLLNPSPSFKQRFSWSGIRSVLHNMLVKKLLLLTALLIAVSFVNPLGIQGVLYSLDKNIGTQADGPLVSMEVQPLNSLVNNTPRDLNFTLKWIWPLIILLGFSFVVGFKRKNIFYLLGSIGAAIMALSVARGSPFFGIFFLLAFSANLTPTFLFLQDWIVKKLSKININLELIAGWFFIIGLILYFCLNVSRLTHGPNTGIGLARDAESAANFFLDNHLTGPIFNDTDIGSYLIWYLYPNEKVFTDNRFGDAYSNQFFEDDYVGPLTDEAKWKTASEKHNFNTIIIYQYDNGYNARDFIARRIDDPSWVWVYGDRYSVILVRNTSINQAIIDKYAITRDNIRDRFGNLLASLDGDDQVAVGDLFALGGYPNWARSSYAIALSQHPKWAKIWWAMGEMELLRGVSGGGDPALGAMFIENAIKYGWATPNSYSYLALAYYQMNFLDAAEEAVKMELELDPKSEDGKRWLLELAKARLDLQNKSNAPK